MARKRMVDPSVWDDPDLSQLPPIERLLFIGLISLADDYGHIAAHAALLRKWIFGYDDIPIASVQEMRDHVIAKCRNVQIYRVDGQEYIWLRKWSKHQDLRFRAKAQYPCHVCGEQHDSQTYQDCDGKGIGERFIANNDPCVDIAHIPAPDYVTSCRVTSCRDTSCHVEVDTEQIAPSSAAAPTPASTKPAPQVQPEHTPGQKLYLAKFVKKRFATPDEREAVAALEQEVGYVILERALTWAAENNIRKIAAVRTTARRIKAAEENENSYQRSTPRSNGRPQARAPDTPRPELTPEEEAAQDELRRQYAEEMDFPRLCPDCHEMHRRSRPCQQR